MLSSLYLTAFTSILSEATANAWAHLQRLTVGPEAALIAYKYGNPVCGIAFLLRWYGILQMEWKEEFEAEHFDHVRRHYRVRFCE